MSDPSRVAVRLPAEPLPMPQEFRLGPVTFHFEERGYSSVVWEEGDTRIALDIQPDRAMKLIELLANGVERCPEAYRAFYPPKAKVFRVEE